jgi:serine phosphatase RsbU (regulator of sigma subunit)/pSer/pThr/pTyr-binding forkhead associated (FHA) protein
MMPRDDRPQGLTLGRHASCDLTLPASAESVSRFHVRFRFDAGSRRWRITDLGSRWGTFLNGVKLSPNTELPLRDGDLLRINPWTFAVGREPRRRRGLMTTDDGNSTMVRTLAGGGGGVSSLKHAQEDMLALLLEAAAAIHDAPDETQLAERLLDAAVRGSGLPNAAVLRPVDTAGRVEILASRLPATIDGDGGGFNFSRSLLNAAADGHPAELSTAGSAGGDAPISHSIVQMNISAALCVPLMLGPAPAAYLYLDARSNRAAFAPTMRPHAAAFCGALGRLAGLALANLKRVDVERRQAMIEHDLNAAAAAQRWVLPPRETKVGPFTVTGESRPGRYVGGDFFDVIDLGDGRLAIALGDVSGKGVEASVLMTATQGFLHAAMQLHGDPAKAVTAANAFVSPRRPDSRFVTLWIAVLDPTARTLTYVDAGHSYAALFEGSGASTELSAGGGPPLGVSDDFQYSVETVPLPPHGRLAIVSDGFVEQPAPMVDDHAGRVEFKMDGVCGCLGVASADEVASLFNAVIAHAGSTQLADDATAVCVRW